MNEDVPRWLGVSSFLIRQENVFVQFPPGFFIKKTTSARMERKVL